MSFFVYSWLMSQGTLSAPIKQVDESSLKQEQSETAYFRQRESAPDPDPDLGSERHPKFNGDFLVQSYSCDKIFMTIQRYEPNCGQMRYLAMLKNPFFNVQTTATLVVKFS